MMRLTFTAMLLLCSIAAWAIDSQPPFPDPVLQARYTALTHELRCLVCQDETVADSNADLAADFRRQIHEMVAAGKTDIEIKAYMVERYGDFVLYRPPVQSSTALLWIGPFVLLLLALGVVTMVVLRRASQSPGDASFFALAACMLLAAGLVIALPLWRARVPERAGVTAANLQVHAARLEELETDLENGRLSREDYAAARRDLEADLSVAASPEGSRPAGQSQHLTAGIALVAVLTLAGSLYWFYGSWRVGSQGVEAASAQAVVEMVDALARRLQTPEGQGDLQGWDMLGHSYMIMGRYVEAMRAFERARALSHDSNPQYLAGYAEALALSHPDDAKVFMYQALPVFEKALQIDPNNTQALWYGGRGALERGDKSLAFKRWNAILAQDPPADYRAYIEKAITDAGGTVVSAATPSVFIGIRVSLTPALAAKAPGGATVFVYAQPKGDVGGPPLAVRRIKVDELPMDIRLSDQDAVVPGRVLSAFEDAIVTARISLSGDATPHAGDLMGQGEWVKADGKPIAIIIDTVVK